MRQRIVVTGIVLLLIARAATIEAQSTGGSFGGSRGFGGGSSGSGSSGSGSGWSGSSGGAGSTGWAGSAGSGSTGSQEAELERRRRDEERQRQVEQERLEAQRLEAQRREQERLEAERREQERLEQQRLEQERLERELALPSAERARSDRFTGSFSFGARRGALAPSFAGSRGSTVAWWGGDAPSGYIAREFRWTKPTHALTLLAFGAIVAAVIATLRKTAKAPPPQALPKATLRVLSLGVDWTRRREVQQRLASLAGKHDLSTAAGMFRSWSELREVLRDVAPAVRYASLAQTDVLVSDAQRAFDARASDLRGRYIIETVRDGSKTAGPTLGARAEEGEGMVVVSVVAGFNRALPAMRAEGALDPMFASLCGDDPEVLVALQTVWSPTNEEDRMSSAELEVRYPELRRLDDGVGRVQCASCKAVWARELGRCPACGAPPA